MNKKGFFKKIHAVMIILILGFIITSSFQNCAPLNSHQSILNTEVGGAVTPPELQSDEYDPASIPTAGNAEFPKVLLARQVSEVKGNGIIVRVNAGGNLQAAIDAATPGTTIELEAGATFTGNFILRNKPGTGWITIRSSRTDELVAGIRVTPEHAALMPKLISPKVNVNSTQGEAVLSTEAQAHNYRLIGIEMSYAANVESGFSLVQLGSSGIEQSTLASVAKNIIIDRSYIHGHPTVNFQRCIALNSSNTSITNSYISECHSRYIESQGIAGWNGPGPFQIVNNYIEGGHINFMLGGGDPRIPNMVPSDVEFRRNHLKKPLAWKGVYPAKNIFETKNVRRMLVEANIFENNWDHGQTGSAIVFKSVNQDGGCGWCVTEDINFRYNLIKNSPKGIQVIGTSEDPTNSGIPKQTNKRITIEQNVLERIGENAYNDGFWQFWPLQVFRGGKDIVIDHNTHFSGNAVAMVMFSGLEAGDGLRITNNIIRHAEYGIFGDGSRPVVSPMQGTNVLNAYATNWRFAGNLISRDGGNTSLYPAGNRWVESFTNFNLLPSYKLEAGSSSGTATDGTDPGVNAEFFSSLHLGVLAGFTPY